MTWRTVIITRRSKLDYKMGYLVIRAEEVHKVFLDEIAVLVIENPAVSLTGCLLEALVEHKIKVMFCDSKRNPMAELMPHHGSYDCVTRIKEQIVWKEETKAAVWQRIIREKISKQQELLQELGKNRESDLLLSYIPQVQPGDTTNREGHAAKVYFNALFGMDFTRGQESPTNAALNYGYSVILSAVNRDITNAGYLTQLGVFHDNRFNCFNLSCDLMEPFRVLVDRAVLGLANDTFTAENKRNLWNILNENVVIDGTNQTVLNAMHIYLRSVLNALNADDPQGIRFYRLK